MSGNTDARVNAAHRAVELVFGMTLYQKVRRLFKLERFSVIRIGTQSRAEILLDLPNTIIQNLSKLEQCYTKNFGELKALTERGTVLAGIQGPANKMPVHAGNED